MRLNREVEVGDPVTADMVILPNTSGVTALDVRVLVMPDKVVERTAGGVFLPPSTVDADKFAMQKATVISVGENAWEEAAERASRRGVAFHLISAGDRVMIGRHTGAPVTGVDGERYLMLNDEDVIGRLSE